MTTETLIKPTMPNPIRRDHLYLDESGEASDFARSLTLQDRKDINAIHLAIRQTPKMSEIAANKVLSERLGLPEEGHWQEKLNCLWKMAPFNFNSMILVSEREIPGTPQTENDQLRDEYFSTLALVIRDPFEYSEEDREGGYLR